MKEALGVKPVFSTFVTSSRMCGSCHTIDLPIMMPYPNPPTPCQCR